MRGNTRFDLESECGPIRHDDYRPEKQRPLPGTRTGLQTHTLPLSAQWCHQMSLSARPLEERQPQHRYESDPAPAHLNFRIRTLILPPASAETVHAHTKTDPQSCYLRA